MESTQLGPIAEPFSRGIFSTERETQLICKSRKAKLKGISHIPAVKQAGQKPAAPAQLQSLQKWLGHFSFFYDCPNPFPRFNVVKLKTLDFD